MCKRITIFAAVLLLASFAAAAGNLNADTNLSNFCASCHGTNGNGPGQSIPFIGGQTKAYLNISLNEMRKQERYSTIMRIITQGYSIEELDRISDWFSTREWQNSTGQIDSALAAKGSELAKPCHNCHGLHGQGRGTTPRIGGQTSQYLYSSMLEYKNGMRNNNGNATMMKGVVDIDDEDIRALAEYFSALR